MKIDWSEVATFVIAFSIAMIIVDILKALFLDSAIEKLKSNFTGEDE